jgi:hypothetical protein
MERERSRVSTGSRSKGGRKVEKAYYAWMRTLISPDVISTGEDRMSEDGPEDEVAMLDSSKRTF